VARLPVEIAQIDLGSSVDVNRALEGVEYVFHCAYDGRSQSHNTDGLRNLIDACASHSVRRLVHVSSFAVYEPFPDGLLTEDTRNGDRSMIYVKTKLDLEKLLFEMARERQVPATIVQPSIVYGPFGKGWTNAVAEMLIYGTVVLPDRGEGLCNAVYIDDLIDGLILAATSGEAVGERFIVSGPEPISWATFFNGFADALEVNPPDYWPRAKIVQKNRSIVRNIRAILTDPRRLIKLIANWGPTRQTLRASAVALPGAIRSALMNYYYAGRANRDAQTFLPDSQTLSRYSFRATASNRKAEIKLGYRPRFTYERGMVPTSAYVKWAYRDILWSVQHMRQKRTLPMQGGAPIVNPSE
jgi:nucleoside-diphosphate-sugar epimerase